MENLGGFPSFENQKSFRESASKNEVRKEAEITENDDILYKKQLIWRMKYLLREYEKMPDSFVDTHKDSKIISQEEMEKRKKNKYRAGAYLSALVCACDQAIDYLEPTTRLKFQERINSVINKIHSLYGKRIPEELVDELDTIAVEIIGNLYE